MHPSNGLILCSVCTSLLLVPLLPHAVRSASADITQCNGVWTNLPCDGKQGKIEEKPYTPPSEESVERNRKRSIFNSFDLERLRIEKEYDLHHDVTLVRDACLEDASPLEACRKAIIDSENLLQKKVETAQRAQPQPTKEPAQPNEQNSVAVVENNEDVFVLHGRDHFGEHDHFDHGDHGVIFDDGKHPPDFPSGLRLPNEERAERNQAPRPQRSVQRGGALPQRSGR